MALSKILNASVTDSTLTTTKLATPNLGRRNIVINGAMQVAQRATSVTGLGNSSGYNTIDRLGYFGSSSGRFTQSQDTDAPDGFSKSLKLACTTADTSIAATEYLHLNYSIEGQDLQQLNYNTSSAKSITISFYVKGNASAIYTFRLQYHLSGGTARWYAKEFPVTTSWVRQTITIPGDVVTGASYGIGDNANTGMFLIWYLHGGANYSSGTYASETWQDRDYTKALGNNQTSFYDSTDRTFFITGLQLEVNSQATPFEHRSFGEELMLCYRYLYAPVSNDDYGHFGTGIGVSSTLAYHNIPLPVRMRAVPSVTTSGNLRHYAGDGGHAITSGPTILNGGQSMFSVQATASGAGIVVREAMFLAANNDTDAQMLFDAEL